MSAAAIFLIRLYQVLLSPDHSWVKAFYPVGYCKFYPSCSEYAAQSLQTQGFIKGLWLSLKRLIKCRPGVLGGIDPVPTIQ